jgi:hypothetical protein
MNTQRFRPWSALGVPNLGRVDFERITYDSGMRIHLKESGISGKKFYLDFVELPTAIRIANESVRLRSLELIPMKIKTSFFLVENSDFLAWLNNDSLDIYKDDPIFHLAIVTDEWIDVICNELPVVVIEG